MDNKFTFEDNCVVCGKPYSVEVDEEGWNAWRNGELIQNALPDMTAGDREFLISQICPTCFDDLFKEDDEDE